MKQTIVKIFAIFALALVALGVVSVGASGQASAHTLTPAQPQQALDCSFWVIRQGNLYWGNSYKVVQLDECETQSVISDFSSRAGWSGLLGAPFGWAAVLGLAGVPQAYADWIKNVDNSCGRHGVKLYLAYWNGHVTWIYPYC